MKLADLLKGVEVTELKAPPELEIADVCYDSRRAAADTLFVAVRGFESDGHRYIYAAAAKGAVCAVCEEPPECDIPYVIVPDSRLALALISVNYFRSPASEMVMMGVTGTNGKTTTTYLLKHILEVCMDAKVGLIGTNGNMIGDEFLPTERTTPESYELQKLLREMADALSMELFAKKLVTDQLVVTIGYDVENIKDAKRRASYKGEIVRDGYGRLKPKHSHGTINLARYTSSTRLIMDAAAGLYDRVVDRNLLIRRLNITACRVIPESEAPKEDAPEQMDMFTDYAALDAERERENAALERERRKQAALLKIKRKYGKNAVLRGMNYEDGATMRDRNGQIGGHKA